MYLQFAYTLIIIKRITGAGNYNKNPICLLIALRINIYLSKDTFYSVMIFNQLRFRNTGTH
jgi:hypothetical protein